MKFPSLTMTIIKTTKVAVMVQSYTLSIKEVQAKL